MYFNSAKITKSSLKGYNLIKHYLFLTVGMFYQPNQYLKTLLLWTSLVKILSY